LAHGAVGSADDARQPVLIGTDIADASARPIVFFVAAAQAPPPCERLLYMFDGDDPAALAAARKFWKNCGAPSDEKHFWNRDEHGKWSEKIL